MQLPFRHFMLTSRGYVKLDDETPLNPAKLRSVSRRALSVTHALLEFLTKLLCMCPLQIGFAIADQKEGDFELRIQWIKAIAQVDQPGSKDEKDDDDDSVDDDTPYV